MRAACPLLCAAAMAALAAPAAAQSAREILYAANGPAVRGLTYCYLVLSGQGDRDGLAQRYDYETPLTEFGTVHPLDAPNGDRRAWRVTYTGSTAGTAAVPENDALSMSIRLNHYECEITISAVPLSEEDQVIGVTEQILEQLDARLAVVEPPRRIAIGGSGPSWQAPFYLVSDSYDARVVFGPRVAPHVGAIWQIELTNQDAL